MEITDLAVKRKIFKKKMMGKESWNWSSNPDLMCN